MIYDAIVIGAGISGCTVAYELSKLKGSFAVLEKGEDICIGTSKANSAIVHAGFDAKPGTHMAKLNVLGNKMMTELSNNLDISFDRCGALVLCFDEADMPKIHDLYNRGVTNGVEGLQVLNREQCLEKEPALSDKVCGALYSPTSGIVCPFEMTQAFAECAATNLVEFYFESNVVDIVRLEDGNFEVITNDKTYITKTVVNCAGVYSDVIHNFICDDKIKVTPRKGEYLLCDKDVGTLVNTTLFQLPTALGKGVLASPTVHGNLILGPTALDIDDKEDYSTTREGIDDVLKKVALSISQVPVRQGITTFSGLRAHTDVEDFILGENAKGFFDVAGIESPGLSSAPAIAQYTVNLMNESLKLETNTDFIATRKGVIKAADLDFSERAKLIKAVPEYGQIICRCEMVSEGEIISSIKRPLGATTIDGVKRRTRAGTGRCQGGFCTPKVMEILSRELNIPYEDLRKNTKNSYLIVGKTHKGGN